MADWQIFHLDFWTDETDIDTFSHSFDPTYPQQAPVFSGPYVGSSSTQPCTGMFLHPSAERLKSSAKCSHLTAGPWRGSSCTGRRHSSYQRSHNHPGRGKLCLDPGLPWTIPLWAAHRWCWCWCCRAEWQPHQCRLWSSLIGHSSSLVLRIKRDKNMVELVGNIYIYTVGNKV